MFSVAAPEFRLTDDGPHDVNVTAGHGVSMHCRTHAEPPADVTWYQNGQPLDRTYPPASTTPSHTRDRVDYCTVEVSKTGNLSDLLTRLFGPTLPLPLSRLGPQAFQSAPASLRPKLWFGLESKNFGFGRDLDDSVSFFFFKKPLVQVNNKSTRNQTNRGWASSSLAHPGF